MSATLGPPYSLSRASLKQEARRRLIVKLVLFIYILSLVEGPLRKWFLPGLSEPLTLLRDPIVIALYAYSLAHGFLIRGRIAKLWLGFACITSVLGLLQYMVAGLPVSGWALGVRTYWLYMPLAFVVANTFTRDDIHGFLKLNLWIAMPYALLIAAQYSAPPFSIMNLGVGGDEDSAVGLGDGILRPFGLFTYTGPNVQFTGAMIAMFVAFYVGNVTIRRRGIFLLMSGAAVGTMSVLTGSRSIYFLATMIIGFTLLGLLLTRPTRRTLRQIGGLLGFVGLAALIFVYIFPDMLSAMTSRFESAAGFEGSIWNRAFGEVFSFVDPLFTSPILGHGIGAGAPGVARILGLPPLIYGESDLQRNINELGLPMGIAMLALRFGTSVWILKLALRNARVGQVMALPLAAFSFYPIALGQITHSPLSGFAVWLSLGLVMALAKNRSIILN